MRKRDLIGPVILLAAGLVCNALGAEQKPNSDASQPKNTALQVTPVGKTGWAPSKQLTGPQDVCPFTMACFSGQVAFTVSGLPGGELCEYQDPAKTCPPPAACPTYPFEVKNVHILFSNANATACVLLVTPGIRRADFTNPACPVPGAMICTGPVQQIVIPPNTQCMELIFPLNPGCCVDTTYFACLNFQVNCPPPGVGPCLDNAPCDPCCSYWDQTTGTFIDWCTVIPSGGNLMLWTDGTLSCQNNCPRRPTGKNHYKTWRVLPNPTTILSATVSDQFIQNDPVRLDSIQYLSNPTRKVTINPTRNDTFNIVDTTQHLSWYKAIGRDLLLQVRYGNQFETTAVVIDSMRYLLVPTQKQPHGPPQGLDHYKAYRIKNPTAFSRQVQLQDQFDGANPELIQQLVPVYFLTPCRKNADPFFDDTTHYVAYRIAPQRTTTQQRQTQDQFGMHVLTSVVSELLLVPTKKLSFGPPPPPECSDGLDNDGDGLIDFPADCGCINPSDNTEAPNPVTQCNDGIDNDGDGLIDLADCGCKDVCDNSESPDAVTQCNDGIDNDGDGLIDFPADPGCANACDNDEFNPPPTTRKNHYKTWRLLPNPTQFLTAQVRDQFIQNDFLRLDSIQYLSNPTRKITINPTRNDTFNIVDTTQHLSWYRARGLDTLLTVRYENQFESTTVQIDSVRYLLVPTQKQPHAPPQGLDHYKAYRIRNGVPFTRPVQLQDQFDPVPEQIQTLVPVYFLTPCIKNADPFFDLTTHYVAYSIFPPRTITQTRGTFDQFGPHVLTSIESDFLLVPTTKIGFCPSIPGDLTGDGVKDIVDIVALINCVVFNDCPFANPPCCDLNCDGICDIVDIVCLINCVVFVTQCTGCPFNWCP